MTPRLLAVSAFIASVASIGLYSALGIHSPTSTEVSTIETTSPIPSPVTTDVESEHPTVDTPVEELSAQTVELLADNFDEDALDELKWAVTTQNDFSEFAVEPVKSEVGTNGKLMMRAATMQTDDSTVKYLGVVSKDTLSLSGKKSLSVQLDWNNQFNGSYLTGAIYLCPTYTEGNPGDEEQWLRLEYVGVPPGKNARLAIWLKDKQTAKWIYDEGWPKEQRTGRKIEKPTLQITFEEDGSWAMTENGKLLFGSSEWKLPFSKAHLYLQMSSHSNYPARSIYFDSVSFKDLKNLGSDLFLSFKFRDVFD